MIWTLGALAALAALAARWRLEHWFDRAPVRYWALAVLAECAVCALIFTAVCVAS